MELVAILEAAGVYYEALDWAMHQQGWRVNVVLANRAKKYIQSLGLLTATTIIAETNGFALFTSQKQLVS